MSDVFYILLAIIALFFVFLIIKGSIKRFKKKFCAICAAVSITWIYLIISYWLGTFENKTIIALLMGLSILGIYYIAEEKANEKLKIFRLPFLLTLIVISYSLLIIPSDIIKIIALLLTLWLIFAFLYFYRNNQNIKSFVKKIVECCKRW